MRTAQLRREQELRQLVLKGVPLCTVGKSGHWKVGALHIFTGAGRWFNEQTGRRGRLNGESMSRILEREYYCQLCPEASEASQRMETLYRKYDEFMDRAAKAAEDYQSFMRCGDIARPQ